MGMCLSRGLVIADGDSSRPAFVHHAKVAEEGSTDQGGVRLSARSQVDTSEPPYDGVVQARNVYLGEMEIDLFDSMSSGHIPAVDDRQSQCRGE